MVAVPVHLLRALNIIRVLLCALTQVRHWSNFDACDDISFCPSQVDHDAIYDWCVSLSLYCLPKAAKADLKLQP